MTVGWQKKRTILNSKNSSTLIDLRRPFIIRRAYKVAGLARAQCPCEWKALEVGQRKEMTARRL